MGYEKPSDKLTFYKAFFSPQWKFLVHTLVQKLHHGMSSAALWHLPSFVLLPIRNLISHAPKEVGILQANAQSIPILTKLSTSKPWKKHKPKRKHTKEPEVPPTESQIEHNLPLPSHDLLPSGEDSLKLKELMDFYTNLSNKVLDLESEVIDIKSTYQARIEKLESRVEWLEEENRGRKIADIDADVKINLEKVQAKAYMLDLDHQEKVLTMLDVDDEEPVDVKEVLEVVTTTKLIKEFVTTAKDDVTAASVEVPKPRKRKGFIIQDPEETTATVTVQLKVQAKDNGKTILIEEPKPLKREV
nr:hypothetical protein [Tanacetum cinerariifolium]